MALTVERQAAPAAEWEAEIGRSIPSMLLARVASDGPNTVLRDKDRGIWRAVTWAELGRAAREVGMALAAMGLRPGEVAAVLSETNPEWAYADLGILSVGGVAAGVYPTDAPEQVAYLLGNSGARVLFVEDEEQLDKALSARASCPALERIVIFDMEGLRELDDPMCVSLAAFRAAGAAHDRAHPGAWEAAVAAVDGEATAILVYTSGTTGPPKGAMITHANVLCQVVNGAGLLDQRRGDERVAFLPMCHVAERILGLYQALYSRTISNYVESPDTLLENLHEVRPTVFGAVPRVWEKFYSGIAIAVADATPLQRGLYNLALWVGGRVVDAQLAGRSAPAGLSLLHRLLSLVVLANVRRAIGMDRVRRAWVGAAPISPELIRWYRTLGVGISEVYGQTENSGIATAAPAGVVRLGSVGRCVPWGELRISPEGEILLRGPHVFAGYWRDPQKTAETLRDGWLHTGDVGTVDAEGHVRITDRMKDIIITAGGKNITPSEIENELKFSPYISDAVVIGDRRKFLSCLIMIDHENVEKWAQGADVPFTNFTSLARAEPVRALIAAEVERVNARFARVESIRAFRLIEHKLEAEDPELTPTMKLKRKFVSEKYRELIDGMYREA